jgi:hypothetical protein
LILCAEHMKPEDIERDAPLTLAEKAGQESTAATSEEAKTEGPEKQSKAEEDSEAQDKASEVSEEAPGESGGFDESAVVTKGGTEDAPTAEPESADLAVTQQQEQVETESEPGGGEGIEEAEDEESHE